MEDNQLIQIIIAIVAIFGLCLSLYNLYIQRKEKNPSIRVTISSSFISTPGIGITSPPLFSTIASNTGLIPVHLSSCGIRLPNNKVLQFIGPDEHTLISLPKTLLPGQSIKISREFKKIAQDFRTEGYSGIIKLNSYYQDEIDNTYNSKKFKFNIDQWL
jgi:hypothetical protein